MSYKVLITGSTGMVGKGVLLESIDHPLIDQTYLINRKPVGISHTKISEHILEDFTDFTPVASWLEHVDACFFCLGVSVVGKSEEQYTRITHDITLNLARSLSEANPDSIFCYVSGAGTDINGRAMWARVKGRTERDLKNLPFKKVVWFRPGFIQPLRGIKSATGWYNAIYAVLRPITPLFKAISPSAITNTTQVGQAMIACLENNDHPEILENKDINVLANRFSNEGSKN